MVVFPFKEKSNFRLWDQTLFSKLKKRQKTEERHFLRTYKREVVKMFKKDSRSHYLFYLTDSLITHFQ